MDINDLRIFARVAAVQNLSAVGAELDVTPGTISKRLQALEDELRVKLFDRTTRSIRITTEGTKFLEHTERVLSEIDAARAAVSVNVEQPAGRLRLVAPSSIARRLLAPAVSSFLSGYPEIDIRIDLTDRVVNLMDEAYDAAIVCGELEDSTLIARRLGPDRHVLVASPSYLHKRGIPKTPADLDQHDCLLLGNGRSWTLKRPGEDAQSFRVSARMQSDDSDLLRWTAIQGGGIYRGSALNVSRDVARGVLAIVLPEYEVVSKSAIWIVYSKSRHMLPRMRALVDHMVQWSRDHLQSEEIEHSEMAAAK